MTPSPRRAASSSGIRSRPTSTGRAGARDLRCSRLLMRAPESGDNEQPANNIASPHEYLLDDSELSPTPVCTENSSSGVVVMGMPPLFDARPIRQSDVP